MLLHLFVSSAIAHAAGFSDADLRQTLRDSCVDRGCVFYFWSPHMPLSVRGRTAVARFARDHRFRLITLLDPGASPGLAEAARVREHWPADSTKTIETRVLIGLGARVHYPGYVFARRGRITGPLIPGVRHARELASIARKYAR